MKIVRYLGAALAALAIGAGAYGVLGRDAVPRSAPNLPYVLLDGRSTQFDALRGKVVLVNFWATSCTVCLQEMPEIVATHTKYQSRGYDTLAVAMRYDAPANVIHYAQSKALPFGVAIDNTGAIAGGFGRIDGTPTSLLIDRQGRIVERYVGAPDFAALHRRIEALLASS